MNSYRRLAAPPTTSGATWSPGGISYTEPPTVSPNLLPALYMSGAALPDVCLAAWNLSDAQPLPDARTQATAMLTALRQCYLFDPVLAEALRCLYAMPSIALEKAVSTTSKPICWSLVRPSLG